MEFLQPESWAEALAAKAAEPEALPIAGGTDVMVELNFARRRPPALLDLSRLTELTGWALDGGRLRLGAGVTYADLTGERQGRSPDAAESPGAPDAAESPDSGGGLGRGGLGRRLPGLAMAARTVGSPQIR